MPLSMEISEGMRLVMESEIFASFELSWPDDFFLERCIQEMMADFPTPPMKFPIFEKPIIKKCEKTSVVCCIIGEKALNDNENNEALTAFTNALRLAPPSSKMVVHCYFWRSLALQKLRAYPESLQDIDRALKLPIIKEQKSNLLNRKKIITDLLLKESKRNSAKHSNERDDIKEETILSYGENEEILGASSAIALVYNKQYGRHFIATRNIKVGDVLMIQKPFMFSLIEEGWDSPKGMEWICDNCLNPTKAPIPCEGCTLPLYCSTDCRSEAFLKFHKMECKIADVRPLIGPQSAMFLRTLMVATHQGERFQEVVNLKEKIQNCKDKRTAGFKDGKLDGTSVNAVLCLLTHMDKQRLSGIVLQSAMVATALKKHSDFLRRNDDVYTLGNLLLFLSYVCHMNLYCIRRNGFEGRIAFGLFPIFNLLNHSCACNTLSYDDKHRNKILRACKNIEKDEQIFVSYNSFQVMVMTTKQRREFLLENKFFMCQCNACERDYTYKPELKGSLKIPAQLKKRLIKKTNDTESLWELLKLVLNKYKHPSMEAKMIELALVNAHMGGENQELCDLLRSFGIL